MQKSRDRIEAPSSARHVETGPRFSMVFPGGEFWRDAKMDRRDAGSTRFVMSLIVCIIYSD